MAAGFYGGYAPRNFFVRSHIPGGAAYPFAYRPYGFMPGFQLPWWGRPPAPIWGPTYPGAAYPFAPASYLSPWVFASPYGYPGPVPLLPYGYPHGWAQPAAAVFMPVSVVRPVAPPWRQGYPLAAPEGLAQLRVLPSAQGKVSSESGSVVGSSDWKVGKDESSQWSKSA